MADPGLQPLQRSRRSCLSQDPTISPTASRDYQVDKGSLVRQHIARADLPGAGQELNFLSEVQGSDNPDPLEHLGSLGRSLHMRSARKVMVPRTQRPSLSQKVPRRPQVRRAFPLARPPCSDSSDNSWPPASRDLSPGPPTRSVWVNPHSNFTRLKRARSLPVRVGTAEAQSSSGTPPTSHSRVQFTQLGRRGTWVRGAETLDEPSLGLAAAVNPGCALAGGHWAGLRPCSLLPQARHSIGAQSALSTCCLMSKWLFKKKKKTLRQLLCPL